jgi:regulator of sigma E protease
MDTVGNVIVAILGLALLMVVHESGHHFAARAFGLRVTRFSIGFGPPVWRHRPRGSDTEYQIALIPFLAYVQVAGMNPFEEVDPQDKGSYANASLTARVATVFGGPLANYLFASVLAFIAFAAFGEPEFSTTVDVLPDTPAAASEMQDGDKIIRVDGEQLKDFEHMRKLILAHPEQPIVISVLRNGEERELTIVPAATGEDGGGQIGVRPRRVYAPLALPEAAWRSVVYPAMVVEQLVRGLARMMTAEETPDVSGPVGIVKYGAQMVEAGPYEILAFLAMLSAYLGGFNLLPVPALDGGRLMFLGYEAVARRKPNARVEAHIHAVGLLMFLALVAVVTVQDFQR